MPVLVLRPNTDPSPALPRLIASLLTIVFLVVLIRTAWISDDALISLRTVLNVMNGFGLTFNIAERVQTFTHPLWLGLLTIAYLLGRNIYLATFVVSMACAGAAFWLAIRHAATPMQSVLVAVVLLWSRAFVDFSTSGLENPLSYVLLAAFVGHFTGERRDGRWLALLWMIAALLYLARPDNVLLVAPMLLTACWRVRSARTIIVAALAGCVPAIAWTAFAVVYYGFPFPNTAYAKLATGISGAELRSQGLLYLFDSIDRDPLTLTAIAFAVAVTISAWRRRPRVAEPAPPLGASALAAGLVLYLLYVVSIGGDFMAGRFIAVPLFGAALLLGRFGRAPRALWGGAAVILVVVGSTSMHVPLWSNSRFSDTASKSNGIIDERGMYFRKSSLVDGRRSTLRNPNWPSAAWERPPVRVIDTCGLMGTAGIEFGPYAHLLDECALADPLLARLPAVYNPEWRTGHYRRYVPAGYRESLERSTNNLQDVQLRRYYDELLVLTRSRDLFSSARLRTIVRMNLGALDELIDRSFYRHAGSRVALGALAAVREEGTPWNFEGNRTLAAPLAVTCEDRPGRRYLDVSLDSDDAYELSFLKHGEIVGTLPLGPVPQHRRAPGLASYTADIPADARRRGFDTIVVTPRDGNNEYAIGHLLLDGFEATDGVLQQRVAARDRAASK